MQVWKCIKCGASTTDPEKAGDHERFHYGTVISRSKDGDGNLLHYMEDIGE